jgi:phosphoglycolate phosphatase-like HAD superfamily hydrolase
MTYSQKKHWVFDLDGTLVDSSEFYVRFLRSFFQSHDVPLAEHEVIESLGTPAPVFLERKLGPDLALKALKNLTDQSDLDALEIKAFLGIDELLFKLKAKGCKVAVWTNRERRSALQVLQATGIGVHVDFSVTPACSGFPKPHVAGLQMIASEFGCTMTDLVLVGDHDVDMKASESAGCVGIRANWHRYGDKAPCLMATETIYNVSDLLLRT